MTWERIQAVLLIASFIGQSNGADYLGKFIGKLTELHHGVSGDVYAVDSRTLHIKDFTYDGQAPAAYFYASTNSVADKRGFKVRDDANDGNIVRRYRKESVTLTLPEGKTLRDIKIFYVWCEEFDVSFGDVKIPRGFDFPRPQKIDALQGVHAISSDNIVIVDAQTLLVPNLRYDGEAPDAKFWVGRGSKPSPQGIRVSDENGKELPLRRYDGKTVVLTLPGDLTVFDIGHFGVWCEQFTVDFGHVQIPQNLNVPPSLKMLGVKPQSHLFYRKPLVHSTREDHLPTVPVQRALVGGHLHPTTFRPPVLNFGLPLQNQIPQPSPSHQGHSTFQQSRFGQLIQQPQYQQPYIQHQVQEGFIQDYSIQRPSQERQDYQHQPLNNRHPAQNIYQQQQAQGFHNQPQFLQQRSIEINNSNNGQGYQPLYLYQNNNQHFGQNQHRFGLNSGGQHNYVPFG